MNKFLLASAAIAVATAASPALAADLPLGPVAPVPPFTWTSCYAGGHAGGASGQKAVTDPVQLVQDQFLGAGTTVGVTTVTAQPTGTILGGQIGCDYQFSPNWVAGFEGAVSASYMKDSVSAALPLGFPGDQATFTARTDMIPSFTARFGVAVDRGLFYVKGGAAWASDKYSITGSFQGTGFDFEGLDLRSGWTAGAGVEWAIWDDWSVKLEYDYYDFGRRTVTMSDSVNVLSGPVDIKQTVQMVKLGLNFHVWSSGW
ncbi:MAG TPA: outer membrane beta-barrel protein [Xanthobacteraceae bacterium]|jgi:outer membrane immunogenic protein|nr:outer membrane beta-barrel protein [Xanthobacteraceae bacterium]